MSSAYVGPVSVILQSNPRALSTHCVAHSLNLAMVKNSKLEAVRIMISSLKEMTNFIRDSAKRYTVFKAAVKQFFPDRTSVKLKSMCETRWPYKLL